MPRGTAGFSAGGLRALLLPLLVSTGPILHLWAENVESVRADDVIGPLAVALGGTLGAAAVLLVISRDATRTALAVAWGVVLALTFGYQLDALAGAVSVDPDVLRWWLVAADLALLLLASIVVWRYPGRLDRLADGFTVMVAIFVAFALPPIVSSDPLGQPLTGAPPGAQPGELAGRDIYYIVLDGYAREDVLADVFAFSNRPFLAGLEERGFYVAEDALANYTRTHLSLASSLNMRYVDDLPPNLTPAAAEDLSRLLQAPAALTALQDVGYAYVHFDTIWWGTADAPLADIRYDAGQGSEFEAVFAQTTLPGRIFPLPTWQELHLRTLAHLPEVAEMAESTVAFAHVLLPHPPFVFDERGRLLKRDAALGGGWSDRAGYVAQLQFLNDWLTTTIDAILARSDRQPIIVIQADHGPWSTHGNTRDPSLPRWERTAILNAYLVPPDVRDELYPSISPVNTFRLLLRELHGLPLPPLADRAMYSPSDTDPRVDVTRELRDQ